MKKTELLERVEMWLMLHATDRPLPNAQTSLGMAAREKVEHDWAAGLLHNVTQLEPVPELEGTPASDALAKAVAFAKTGNAAHLPEIGTLLRQVHTALRKGPQA